MDTSDVYVIVYCGYEGIEHILWAGTDAEVAAGKVKEIRRRLKQIARENHPVTRISEAEDGHEYVIDSRSELPYPWRDMEDPNRVCVQGRDRNYEIGLKCCCGELKVGTKKKWLY